MIATRDSFYLATVSQSGWPYIQHRGGPPGFLHLLDDTTRRWPISAVTASTLLPATARQRPGLPVLMDYPRRAAENLRHRRGPAAEDHPQLLAQVAPANYRARIERLFLFHLQAFDWNCPQHITPRYSAQQVAEYSQNLQQRIHDRSRRISACSSN